MTQGPPTPPPSSTTEIQDQVRDAVASAAEGSSNTSAESAPPTPAPVADSYQQAFPQICDLASQSDFSALAQFSELSDLKGRNARSHTRLLVVVPLILAYLIQDDLTLAHLVLVRLPENLRVHPLIRAIENLLTSASERQYVDVYSHAGLLCTFTQQSEFPDDILGNLVASMVAMFVESFRRRTYFLLSQAMSSIKTTQAQAYLGFTREQLLSGMTCGTWQYNPASDTLHPLSIGNTVTGANYSGSSIAIVSGIRAHTLSSVPSTLDTFHSVSNGLINLEAGL
ncbi:hypothetical protein ID866_4349 [Astraeus odoratus]|nr:hypothetical protein ID866_4349 [Astraeus odoratus]